MAQLLDSLLDVASSPPTSPTAPAAELPPDPDSVNLGTGNSNAAAATEDADSDSTLSAANNPRVGDKRRAEDDLIQSAQQMGRRVRLKPAAQQALDGVATILWIVARMLKHEERLDTIQPAEAQWTLPRGLKEKIEVYSHLIIVSPLLPAYVRGTIPNKRIVSLFERHTQWGYTPEVCNNSHKNLIVMKRITQRICYG
ncbi:uncharacterized protein B0H18DRAFT_1122931 [Fomitopsis serialis]|uniref:uncharacterized protein n=1 Tax=Fomitopsis serialis TaxID=139415 RepID=UPI0020077113|nr:uncharacterized protein B0H18DRAFT_1122931 [Neoantrodia serialis]KAH9918681.1 hypothetical protein B0H18DRAFT_1122931 [Neoantrodia serialis]